MRIMRQRVVTEELIFDSSFDLDEALVQAWELFPENAEVFEKLSFIEDVYVDKEDV